MQPFTIRIRLNPIDLYGQSTIKQNNQREGNIKIQSVTKEQTDDLIGKIVEEIGHISKNLYSNTLIYIKYCQIKK